MGTFQNRLFFETIIVCVRGLKVSRIGWVMRFIWSLWNSTFQFVKICSLHCDIKERGYIDSDLIFPGQAGLSTGESPVDIELKLFHLQAPLPYFHLTSLNKRAEGVSSLSSRWREETTFNNAEITKCSPGPTRNGAWKDEVVKQIFLQNWFTEQGFFKEWCF